MFLHQIFTIEYSETSDKTHKYSLRKQRLGKVKISPKNIIVRERDVVFLSDVIPNMHANEYSLTPALDKPNLLLRPTFERN